MFPKGLKPPPLDSMQTCAGTPVRPVDYPVRLPFVPNVACQYGESDSVAMCCWEMGQVDAAEFDAIMNPVQQVGEALMAGQPTDKQRVAEVWAKAITAPAPALERLHDLLDTLCEAAAQDGWQQVEAQEFNMPPGGRFRRFRRGDLAIIAMAVPTPFTQGLAVYCFTDQGA